VARLDARERLLQGVYSHNYLTSLIKQSPATY
jgi:hypothetical protein